MSRHAFRTALPLLGAMLIVATVFLPRRSVPLELALVLVGLGLIQTRMWKRANVLLPNERRYVALRRELDDFIQLVRRLNRVTLELTTDASPQNRARVLDVRDRMLESVKRMETVAGRDDADTDP